jgi:hypothetical protein
VDYADVECILPKDRGNEEGQIQHQIKRHGGMQCMLCDGIRIFLGGATSEGVRKLGEKKYRILTKNAS